MEWKQQRQQCGVGGGGDNKESCGDCWRQRRHCERGWTQQTHGERGWRQQTQCDRGDSGEHIETMRGRGDNIHVYILWGSGRVETTEGDIMRGYRENGYIVREGGDNRNCESRGIGDNRVNMGEGGGNKRSIMAGGREVETSMCEKDERRRWYFP